MFAKDVTKKTCHYFQYSHKIHPDLASCVFVTFREYVKKISEKPVILPQHYPFIDNAVFLKN